MPCSRRNLLAMTAGAVALAGRAASAADWKPTRPIELIVPSGAGGGLDVIARVLQRLIHDLKLTDQPVNVVNKPGGSGVIGILYNNQHKADGHYLVIQAPGLLTNELVGATPIGLKDVTPVGMLVDEQIMLSVAANSPFRTGQDLAHALGTDPGSVSVAMSASPGSHSHIAVALVTKAAGGDPRKLKTVFYNGGGEAVTALMGEHVNVTITPASTILGPFEAGRIRVLAYSAAKRVEGPLAAVPTWKEQGIDVVFAAWRALSGAIGMTPPQLAWWDNTLAAVTRAPEWTDYVRQNAWTADYRGSADTARFFRAERDRLAPIIAELDLVKKG